MQTTSVFSTVLNSAQSALDNLKSFMFPVLSRCFFLLFILQQTRKISNVSAGFKDFVQIVICAGEV